MRGEGGKDELGEVPISSIPIIVSHFVNSLSSN